MQVKDKRCNVALFASGNGSNVERIYEYFSGDNSEITPNILICNKKDAFVFERAKRLGLDAVYVSKQQLNDTEFMLKLMQDYRISYIILAGFLALVPSFLIREYPNRIINIHPALLPLYGGKGMYGSSVHKAVIADKNTESGVTIHTINENYDEGDILFQAKCSVEPIDTAESLAQKIHKLEYKYFPIVIEKLIKEEKIVNLDKTII